MSSFGLFLLSFLFLGVTYIIGRILGFTQVEKMCQLIRKKVKEST